MKTFTEIEQDFLEKLIKDFIEKELDPNLFMILGSDVEDAYYDFLDFLKSYRIKK